VDLADAIGTVGSDPASTFDDLLLGLDHPGFVAEQAAFALYARTGQSLPVDRDQMLLTRAAWEERLRAMNLRHSARQAG